MWAGVRATLRQARFDRNEAAGALGDLGTFLPLLLGMAEQNGLSFATGLFFAGFFNLVTGCLFAIPMAVQPMKAIAAVALTQKLTVGQIGAAGASVGAVLLLLSALGLINWLNRVISKSVVRGLQLALGLSLVMKGLQLVAGTHAVAAPDSYLTAALGALVVLALFFSRRVPAAFVLFGAGLVLAIAREPGLLRTLVPSLTLPRWMPPAWADFRAAFVTAAVPQLPLTTFNSVIAVCALSADLFPGRPASPRRVALSVGVMNLAGVWFGAMPMCHGAGGLAGQYRFGARTNGSILLLGAAKMALAVLFGASLAGVCRVFPVSLLGVMLAFSGIELAMATRDQTDRTGAFAMLFTAGACLGLGYALGVALGIALTWGLRAGMIRIEPPQPIPRAD